eukprot:CAMPEP_0115605546 /NCGR_PEP_ID=MMETSP0272-20121206/17519_1 /TAXON_ID=71861 /ORGANISM="Scrippsiella trochoidea, Strain CCMP3099" /LENGTH=662 /DNA_ID=CAMNT_0003041143 /DNA_START=65 /DNA_END=2053 /DNA_ORIENTATION=+
MSPEDMRMKILELNRAKESLEQQLANSNQLKAAVDFDMQRAKVVKSADVCFVFDCTGSMFTRLEAAANKMREVQHFIMAYLGGHSTTRFAIVGYRDYGHVEHVTVQSFTDDAACISKTLRTLSASSRLLPGAQLDLCEDLVSGLEAAMKLPWKSTARVLYLVCDWPQHGRRFHDFGNSKRVGEPYDNHLEDPKQWEAIDCVFQSLEKKGIDLVCLRLAARCDKMYTVFSQLHDNLGVDVSTTVEVLDMNDSPADFAKCVTQSAQRSISRSLVRFASRQQHHRVHASTFPIDLKPFDWDTYMSWPQHKVELVSYAVEGVQKPLRWHSTFRRVHLRPAPFSKGAMRYAFPAVDEASGARLVVKVYKFRGEAWRSTITLDKDARVQALAQYFADEFSRRAPDCALQFVPVQRMRVIDGSQMSEFLRLSLTEPFIPGNYEKYTSNGSYIGDNTEVVQAFTHFTWHFSQGQLMVVDIQGANLSVLTDPQIHSSFSEEDHFGCGDLGRAGMDAFFLEHRCNQICHHLHLEPSPMQKAQCQTPAVQHDSAPQDKGGESPASSVSSVRTERSSVPTRSFLCGGRCGSMVDLTGRELLRAKAEHGDVFCAACLQHIEDSSCIMQCASPGCKQHVRYSYFALCIAGKEPPPLLCAECTANKLDQEWELLSAC